jgi:SAM-dependent methyltransferase
MTSIYAERAELYDFIYSWKSYAAEVARVREILAGEGVADGATLLDAGCGTGEHLVHLARTYRASGFDKSPEMVAVARRKLPGVELFEGDFRDFSVATPFRALVSLFSGIGYVHGEAGLRDVAARFAAAVEPTGVLIVEPWLTAEDCAPGFASMHTYDSPELKLCRQAVTRVEGDMSVFDMHWLVARANQGVEHFVEHHELWMCPRATMAAAFEEAGFDVCYEPDGLMKNRGLFVGRRRRF